MPEIEKVRKLIIDTYSNKLKFIEETHQYFLGDVEFDCVSHIVDKWCSINEEEMLEKCAIKALKYPDYKYFGMTKDEISALWKQSADEACRFGTSVHLFGEGCFYWFTGQDDMIPEGVRSQFTENGPKPTNKHEEAVLRFWNDLPENFVPVLSETKVFNIEGTPYAGTFDILFYYVYEVGSDKNGLILMDYKTNASLTNDYARGTNGMMLSPFNDLYEESLSHYYLQFCLYQVPIEDLGFRVIGRRLIWLKSDGNYEKIKTPDISNRLRKTLNIKK